MFGMFVFTVYLLATHVLRIQPVNVAWFCLGLASYVIIIRRSRKIVTERMGASTAHVPTDILQDQDLDSQKDGVLMFVILSLAMTLFPIIPQAREFAFLAVGLAATVIAVLAVMVDYAAPTTAAAQRKFEKLAAAKGLSREFADSLVTYYRHHVIVRSLVLLMIGVVLVYNVAALRQSFPLGGSG